MDRLKPSSDRKTQAYPGQKNTFGTLPGKVENGGTCPGATTGPGGCQHIREGRKIPACYVVKLTKIRKNVEGVLAYNTNLLNEASYDRKVALFIEEFMRFYKEEKRRGKVKKFQYRIHWSGDVPTMEYCEALKEAIRSCPFIGFWGYTRSMFTVPVMAGIKNLRWYISLDEDNYTEGLELYHRYEDRKNIHVAYMGEKKRDVEGIKNLVPCPVDIGKKALENACQDCRLCLWGKPVWFPTRY